MIVANYIHGFKEFDTSVLSGGALVSVAIYHDVQTQSYERALQLKKRFVKQIPEVLRGYVWARNVKIEVQVISEDRSGRGYWDDT